MEPDPSAAARADLDALVDLAWGDGGAAAVRAFLRKRFATDGCLPYAPRTRDRDDGPLVAWIPGREPDRRPLVLTARTDLSGASALAAVVAVLAAVPRLVAARSDRATIVALCDEARPGGGFARWFDEGRRHDVKAGLVLGRLVPGVRVDGDDVLEVAGVETDARLPDLLDEVRPTGLRPWPTRHVVDGLPFAGHGVPYLRLGQPALGPTRGPRVDVAAAARLAARTGAWVAALAVALDGARLPGPYGGYDSTAYEVAATSRALGPALADLGGAPVGRDDLTRLADRLRQA